ncbi:MAG: EutN/CcmL family microcompartment protein [Chlorobi bacterium]|nr:EutN/CcmL family microcompartment protein [Chlorobiota bacterium]
MILAKVIGNVVSTQKNKNLKGHKLLLVKEVNFEGEFINNKDALAIDLIDAGIGDTVIVAREGDAVKQILGNGDTPVNTVIIAIVDNIDINEE